MQIIALYLRYLWLQLFFIHLFFWYEVDEYRDITNL